MTESFEPQSHIDPEIEIKNNLLEQNKDIFLEIEGRLKYKYYFHGTARKNLENIRNNGFEFTEGFPSLSVSAWYSIKNWTDPNKLIEKRRLQEDEEKQGILLVIEPKDYKVYPSERKTFSKSGIERKVLKIDGNKIWATGQWANWHHFLAKPDKEIELGERKYLAPDEIKMIINPEGSLKNILERYLSELRKGNLPNQEYVNEIKRSLYFNQGNENVIYENKLQNFEELSENIIAGELERYVVNTIRKIILNIWHYQGYEVLMDGDNKPHSDWGWDEKRLIKTIESLKKLEPLLKDKFLQLNLDKALIIINADLKTIQI